MKRIAGSALNPNPGMIPVELDDLFAFLDGHGDTICRTGEAPALQNSMWNGYLHGHQIMWLGASFPDGMVVIDGPFPGEQTLFFFC